jgi:hypothetical protein
MVNSFIKNFNAIDAILKRINTQVSLTLVMHASEERTAVELKRLYEIFSDNFNILQRGGNSTAIFYLPVIYKVRKALQAGADDEECSIRDCFKVVLDCYNERITKNIPKEFLAATSLDPDQLFSDYNKEIHEMHQTQIQDVLIDMAIKYEVETNHINQQQHNHETHQKLQPEKKRKMQFLESITQAVPIILPQHLDLNQEIAQYMQAVAEYDIQNDDTFDFWRRNRIKFPLLFKLVLAIFPIPASSADAERSFSVAGVQLRCNRANMNPHRAHKALFIHDNIHLLEEKMQN